MNRDQLIMKWQDAVTALAAAQEAEKELRGMLVASEFDADKDEGTQNVELGNGYKLQCVKRVNYSLDKTKVETAIEKIEALGDEERFIADRLVTFEPKLSTSEYKKLPPKVKKIIDTVITTRPGTPSLKLVEPKAKK